MLRDAVLGGTTEDHDLAAVETVRAVAYGPMLFAD